MKNREKKEKIKQRECEMN